jgi:hypothetical protein
MRASVAELKYKPCSLAASAGHRVANQVWFGYFCKVETTSEMLLALRLDAALGAVPAQVPVSR